MVANASFFFLFFLNEDRQASFLLRSSVLPSSNQKGGDGSFTFLLVDDCAAGLTKCGFGGGKGFSDFFFGGAFLTVELVFFVASLFASSFFWAQCSLHLLASCSSFTKSMNRCFPLAISSSSEAMNSLSEAVGWYMF